MQIKIMLEESDQPVVPNRVDNIVKIKKCLGIGLKDAKDLYDGASISLDRVNCTTKKQVLKDVIENLNNELYKLSS